MKIAKRVSTVDKSKCVGCRSCEIHCPVGAIKVGSGNGDGTYVSPCQQACPAGIDVSGYIALAAAGRYEDAYRLIRRDNPFPSICGRICTHPCQAACNRGTYDNAVAIRDIKRFVADKAFEVGVKQENVWPTNGKSVGIIGAGPSGLTCAYYLALSGYEVEVYDSAPRAGGVLTYGIPEWRLPSEVIDREVKAIEEIGVNIHLNTNIGKDTDFGDLRKKHQALYIATGTQFSRKAGVKGEDMPGVTHGLDFLRQVNSGSVPDLTGKKVVVIGGGNTAMDASRTARRLGAEDVIILYRRREVDMPADLREVMEAKEEGIRFVTMATPQEFEGNGKVEKIRYMKMKLGETDANGRRATLPTDEEAYVEADVVIVAVSQYSEFPFINADEVEMTEWGKLITNEEMMTTMPGVFAGGDVARGSATAIEAIADGKLAAKKIASFLGLTTPVNQGAEIRLPEHGERKINYKNSGKMRNLAPAERVKGNEEVALGLTEEMLQEEAARCYRCSGRASVDPTRCVDCGICWEHCNYGAIEMQKLEKPVVHKVPPMQTDEERQAVREILIKSHYLPMTLVCPCSLTFGWEVAYSIVRGSHTLEDISMDTGARTGCAMWCTVSILNILEAAGYPQTPPESGGWVKTNTSLFTLTKEQCCDHPDHERYDIEGNQQSAWNEQAFEAQWAMLMKQQEGTK